MRQIVLRKPRLIFTLAGLLLGLAYGYLAESQALALIDDDWFCTTSLDWITAMWAVWGALLGLMFGTSLHKLGYVRG